MTLGEEASRSLHGAWGLLRRDPAAPTAFNATLDGFWRSFAAAVLLLPLDLAYLAMIGPAEGTEQAAPGLRWSVNVLVYVIGWTSWPLIAFYLARAMGCGERYLGYVVAYNWSQILSGPLLIGLDLLGRGALPQEIAVVLNFAGLGGVLFYEYLIARQMLAVTAGRAVVVVLCAFVLALVLRDTADFALKLAAPESP
ncbi:MAG TPA: hypothetical protein VIF14_01185 [Alphaproteobacteria bacterium]|jgi:hypothetical protein